MENLIGLLKVRVRRGINLVVCDTSSSDPYVIVTMGSQKLKTRVVGNTCNPEWNDELTLAIHDPNAPVKLTVFDEDTFSRDDDMGEADLDIHPIMDCRTKELNKVSSGTVVSRVNPNKENCLAQDSEIVWKDKKLQQNMILKLNNVERGEVEIQLEWIDIKKKT